VTEQVTELTVDSRGRRCPLPIIDLAGAARRAPRGSLITLIADDPAAAADVPAWCRMRGQGFEGSERWGEAAASAGRTDGAAVAYRVRVLTA
jgi:tRNA 2-thiouridine synthesizing protein A